MPDDSLVIVNALLIGLKDLRQRVRDRSALIMGVVAPLGLVLILDATLGSVAETTRFEFAVLNEDRGELGAAFEGLMDELEADGVAVVTDVTDRSELDDLVADGSVNAGFVVPPSFTEATRSGNPGQLVVVGDRSAPISVSVAEAIAESFASEVDYVTLAVASAAATGAGDPTEIAALAQTVEPPIALDSVTEEGRGFDPTSYYAISLSVFFLFFTVQFGVLSLLEEEEAGTLARLRTAPMSPAAIIVGKLVSSFVLGVGSMAVMVVATTVLMGAVWGDALGVAVFVVLGVLTAVSLAAVVSSVARTAEQAGAYASMAAVVLGLLGGAFFPISSASDLIGAVSYISPHRWLLEGLRDVSYGVPLSSIGGPLLAIAVFIVVTGSVGLMAAAKGVAQR
ncbi:MAG: ABC transporter permease [Acidimicrobiia bacterium]|nr:ABC transporter permease [Acidimicrobiia bacterium]